MAKGIAAYCCSSCGAPALRWAGRCPECGEWNTLVTPPVTTAAGPAASPPVPLGSVDRGAGLAVPTGLDEVDRVLSGGLVAGSLTLLYGEPGVGKSTLLLQVLMARAAGGAPVLLASAEESAGQVRARAERLGPLAPGLLVSDTADLGSVIAAVTEIQPALVVVDSIQTITDHEVPGPAGSLRQVRSCAERLGAMAKITGTPVLLVGHVTKDGNLAGPRALEHLVDTVASFEGDRHHALRLLRAVKHRFGATGEIGLFEMGEDGLVAVRDPGPLLLGDRRPEVPGSAVTALLEGRRPLVVELQALAGAAVSGSPRRSAQGVDPHRLATVLAVLECRAGLSVGALELFVSAAGGIRASEPAADLPLALAVASGVLGRALPPDLISFGEVGLAGEVRGVPGAERRLMEAARLGFTQALVPTSTPPGPDSLRLFRVASLPEALAELDRLGSEGDLAPISQFKRADRLPASPGTMPGWATPATSR